MTPEKRMFELREFTEKGEFDKALGHFEVLKKIRPTDPIVLFNGAKAYFGLEMYDSSLVYAKKYCALYSDDSDGYRLLYKVGGVLEDYSQQLWALSQLGYKEKNRARYLPDIAELNLKNENPGLAVAVCRDILEYDPENSRVLFTLATGLMSIGKSDSAILVLEHLDRNQPNQVEVLANLATYYAVINKVTLAEDKFGQLTVLFPDFLPGWFGLGNVLALKGDTAGALEAYENVFVYDSAFLGVDTLMRNLGGL